MKKLFIILILLLNYVYSQEQEVINYGESIYDSKSNTMPNDYVKANLQVGDGANQTSHYQVPKSEVINYTDSYTNNIEFQKTLQSQNNEEEMSDQELALLKNATRNQNLNALQNKFFTKKYSGYENTTTITYTPNKTQKIRTRFAMATTLIFDSEIVSYILGDQTGFNVEELQSIPNAIAIKPLLIGIDTSLTIFTADKAIHTFYLFSTDYKNTKDPNFVIYIKNEKQKEVKQQEKEYLVIKDGIAELKVDPSQIRKDYEQTALKKNEWLKSAEIFSDTRFTFFKYEKDKMPNIPVIFAIIDDQDSPVETRIIGDYIIAETISPKWSIKSGESFVCVRRSDAPKCHLKEPKPNKALNRLQGKQI